MNSIQELDCLNAATKQNTTWRGNFNYWTSGTQQGCKGAWSWCSKSDSSSFNDVAPWDNGQPDNKGGQEDCIHLRLAKLISGPTGFFLNDRNCTNKYVLACKVN